MTPIEAETKFTEIFRDSITRHGADAMLEYLQKSDFFIAPSSTRFHGAYKGGLVVHSVNVYNRLKEQINALNLGSVYSEESIAIVSLLHDVCKINCYKEDFRNQKLMEGGNKYLVTLLKRSSNTAVTEASRCS